MKVALYAATALRYITLTFTLQQVMKRHENRNVGISYCRLLCHDTMLTEDAYRTGLSETPVCECGFDTESAGHILLCCTRYKEARTELSDTVSDILGYQLEDSHQLVYKNW